MPEQPQYHGESPVLLEVLKLNDRVSGVADLFLELKEEAEIRNWGLAEVSLDTNCQLEAAEQLIGAGLAHWENRPYPGIVKPVKILVLTKN